MKLFKTIVATAVLSAMIATPVLAATPAEVYANNTAAVLNAFNENDAHNAFLAGGLFFTTDGYIDDAFAVRNVVYARLWDLYDYSETHPDFDDSYRAAWFIEGQKAEFDYQVALAADGFAKEYFKELYRVIHTN